MKGVRLRPLAEDDWIDRNRYYRSVGGQDLSDRFIDAAVATLDDLEALPKAGSPRSADLTGIPELRSRTMAGFKCGWFYVERADHIDVVRLVSYSQDLGAMFESELDG